MAHNSVNKPSPRRDLFGGALLKAGLKLGVGAAAAGAVVPLTPTDAQAQCAPAQGDQVDSSAYHLGNPPYNIYGFGLPEIAGDRLHVWFGNYQSSGSYLENDLLLTFDISNPNNLVHLGTWETGTGSLATFSVVGSTMAIMSRTNDRRLLTYSLADPDNALPLGSLALTGRIDDIFAVGDTLFVTTFFPHELVSISLTDPLNPAILDSIAIPDASQRLEEGPPAGGLLPVVTDPGASVALTLFDISDPANLTMASSTSLGVSSATQPTIVGNAVFAITGGDQFVGFDVTDPVNPVALPTYQPATGADLKAVRAGGLFIYAIDSASFPNSGDFYAFDFSDPSAPVQTGFIPSSFEDSFPLSDVGDGVFIRSLDDRLDLIDVSSCAVLPGILAVSPGGATNEGGSPVQLNVVTSTVTDFQWLMDGVPIADNAVFSGTTTDTLTIAADLSAAGLYSVEVSNPHGSDTSPSAIVAIRPGPGTSTGACCLPAGDCMTGTEADCIAEGGTYQGDGADCGSVSCPAPDPGDFDFDGDVDLLDYQLFQLAFTGP